MKELLEKLKGIPETDNKIDEVLRIIEEHPELGERYIKSFRWLLENYPKPIRDKKVYSRQLGRWEWMYDHACYAIMLYYVKFSEYLGEFDMLGRDGNIVGGFKIKLPAIIGSKDWDFRMNGTYPITGVLSKVGSEPATVTMEILGKDLISGIIVSPKTGNKLVRRK